MFKRFENRSKFIIFTHQIKSNMGRGDKKSRKGKIFKGSFGKTRPHKVKKDTAKAKG
jgi:30S ribosomal protein S31